MLLPIAFQCAGVWLSSGLLFIIIWQAVLYDVSTSFYAHLTIIRIMCKVDQHTSCRNLSRTLGILPLPCLYISEMVCWIKYYRGKLELNSDLHNYNTRHKTDLHPLTRRINLAKNSGLNMGIILYNRLPQNIKKLDTKHIFKNGVKKFLLQHVFYSVDEYLFS